MLARIRRITWKTIQLSMALSLFGVTVALAAGGDMDGSFSGDGKVTTGFGTSFDSQLQDIAQQADGKLVAVGYRMDPLDPSSTTRDFVLARYNTNGSADMTFSGDSKQRTNFGGLDEAYAVAIRLDGKIVVAGQTCNNDFSLCDVAVARYNTNGSLDTTFSGDGKDTLDFGEGDNGTLGGMFIQPDNKIVIAGYLWNEDDDYDFAVYRLNANGGADGSFNDDGIQNINFGTDRQDEAFDVVLQGANIVVAGQTCSATWTDCNFAVARLSLTGGLDSTFSGDGKQVTDFGGNDYAYAMALQPNDKIVVVGETTASTYGRMAVARYLTNGSLDGSFSTDGRYTLTFGSRSVARAVEMLPNDKIMIAGSTCDAGYFYCDFAMARLNPGGGLNTAWSGDGKVQIDFGGIDNAETLIEQSDGKLVLGGSRNNGIQVRFAVARVKP